MLDARWQLWKQAYDSGETCGEPFGTGHWRVTCNLPPGHPLPHEARRGQGTVVRATWPWQPVRSEPTDPAMSTGKTTETTGANARPARSRARR